MQPEYTIFHLPLKEQFQLGFLTRSHQGEYYQIILKIWRNNRRTVLILDPPDTASRAIITNDWNEKCSKDSTAKRLMSWLNFFGSAKNSWKAGSCTLSRTPQINRILGRWSWVSACYLASCRLILMIKVVHKTLKLNCTCSLSKEI